MKQKILLLLNLLVIAFFVAAQQKKDTSFIKKDSAKTIATDVEFISVEIESEFVGGQQGWIQFLQKNLRANLGSLYIKVPKGQKMVKQKINAQFTVDKEGNLSDISIINADEVHPNLAEEVIRVLTISPKWKPAIQRGVFVKSRKKQSISFVVSEE